MLRSPARTLNKRILEALIKAGAMKDLTANLRSALVMLGESLEQWQRKRREFASQQSALFEVAEPVMGEGKPESEAPWNVGELLQAEREVLGFYLTGHPLEQYMSLTIDLGDCNLGGIADKPDGSEVVIPVGVSGLRPYHGARGTMAFVQVEDLHGQVEMVCFAKVYDAAAEFLHADVPLLVAARVDRSKDEPVLIAEAIAPLDTILSELVDEIEITAASIAWDEMTLARLKSMAQGGDARLAFHVRLPDASIAHLVTGPCFRWNDSVKSQLDARFGPDAVRVHCRPWQPPRKQQARRG